MAHAAVTVESCKDCIRCFPRARPAVDFCLCAYALQECLLATSSSMQPFQFPPGRLLESLSFPELSSLEPLPLLAVVSPSRCRSLCCYVSTSPIPFILPFHSASPPLFSCWDPEHFLSIRGCSAADSLFLRVPSKAVRKLCFCWDFSDGRRVFTAKASQTGLERSGSNEAPPPCPIWSYGPR
jgi:hypothetical protein